MIDINQLNISEIDSKQEFMMRKGLDKALVAEYKENLENIIQDSPIEVYKTPDGYVLIDGFHRIAAARQLNWEKIKARVKIGTITDAHAAACLANLKHGKSLSHDERIKAIKEYIKIKVKFSNVLIARDVGVGETTIRRYRQELEAINEINPQEERIGVDNRIISTPTSPFGEVKTDLFEPWFIEHILEGDALSLMPNLNRKFDLIISDPPYGITEEKWDLKNKYDLLAFTRNWVNSALKLLKPTGRLFIFWSRQYMFELKPLIDEIATEYPLEFGGVIVWNFRNSMSMPDNQKRFKLTWEPIFYYYGLEAPELVNTPTEISGKEWGGDERSDVWTFAIPQSNFGDKRIHPTQKPLDLYKRIIETSTKTGDSILDPFAGSGTTGHAALLTGRDCFLIEKNPDYITSIAERLRPIWEQQEMKNNGK